MKARYTIILPVLALSLASCAGVSVEQKAEKADQRSLELKRSLDEIDARLEELNNKFLLLHEKVEANRRDLQRFRSERGLPPGGLKVVTLDEEVLEKKTDSVKKNGEKADNKVAGTRTASKAAPARKPEAAGKGAAQSPEALYNRGQNLFMSGDYNGAREVFGELAERYPGDDLADNALYWAGEAYYSEQDYERALDRFIDLLNRYPEGNKAPDAFLKVVYSYIEMEQVEKARSALSGLLDRYPGTEAARKAQARFSSIEKKDGTR